MVSELKNLSSEPFFYIHQYIYPKGIEKALKTNFRGFCANRKPPIIKTGGLPEERIQNGNILNRTWGHRTFLIAMVYQLMRSPKIINP